MMGREEEVLTKINRGFTGDAHRELARLFWFESRCSRPDKGRNVCPVHWGHIEPIMHLVDIDCLGVINSRKKIFEIHGVVPRAKLPNMTVEEKNMMLAILRQKLELQLDYEIGPIKKSVVDWDGVDI